MELWLAKLTAIRQDVSTRPSGKQASSAGGLSKADYAMNPAILEIVESAILELTGLRVPELFTTQQKLLIHTASYCIRTLKEIADELEDDVGLELLKKADKNLKLYDRNKICE